MKSVKNLNFSKDLYLDLFLPNKEEFYTIINFHGGGLLEGDKGDTHQYCEYLASLGFAVATANYSLLTEEDFPECLYDSAQAVKYVIKHISKYGKSKGFIVAGQSAGAWITLMLCFNKDYLKSVGIENNEICGWVSDSGQTTSHFNILERTKHLNPWVQRIDETAPLYYVDEKVNFSRLLLLAYEKDLPNRVEQNELLMSTILNFNKKLNVRFEILDGYHCSGSSELNEDGEYEAARMIREWVAINEKKY